MAERKKIKGLDNGVLDLPDGDAIRTGWGKILAPGENEHGFTAQCPHGTSHADEEGKNNENIYGENASGERWSGKGKWMGNRTDG